MHDLAIDLLPLFENTRFIEFWLENFHSNFEYFADRYIKILTTHKSNCAKLFAFKPEKDGDDHSHSKEMFAQNMRSAVRQE